MVTKCYLNSDYIHSHLINLGQKVLGRNYTLAPVPWQLLGRMSLLPLVESAPLIQFVERSRR